MAGSSTAGGGGDLPAATGKVQPPEIPPGVQPGPPTDRKFTEVSIEFGAGPMGMQVDNDLIVRVVVDGGQAKELGLREGDRLAGVQSEAGGSHSLVGMPHGGALDLIKAASRPMTVHVHRPLSASGSGVGSSGVGSSAAAKSQPAETGPSFMTTAAASFLSSMRTAGTSMAKGATEMATKARVGFSKLQDRIQTQIAGQRLGPESDPDH